jgi:hypothetical protein
LQITYNRVLKAASSGYGRFYTQIERRKKLALDFGGESLATVVTWKTREKYKENI